MAWLIYIYTYICVQAIVFVSIGAACHFLTLLLCVVYFIVGRSSRGERLEDSDTESEIGGKKIGNERRNHLKWKWTALTCVAFAMGTLATTIAWSVYLTQVVKNDDIKWDSMLVLFSSLHKHYCHHYHHFYSCVYAHVCVDCSQSSSNVLEMMI
jgi:hypothetical protein